MICYLDMTFCSRKCGNVRCKRNFTEEKREGAKRWWGSEEAPVAFSDMKDGDLCEGYVDVK